MKKKRRTYNRKKCINFSVSVLNPNNDFTCRLRVKDLHQFVLAACCLSADIGGDLVAQLC